MYGAVVKTCVTVQINLEA